MSKLFHHLPFPEWLINFCQKASICLTSDWLVQIPCHRMSLPLCKPHYALLVMQRQLCMAFLGKCLMIYQILCRLGEWSSLCFKLTATTLHLLFSWHLQLLLHVTTYFFIALPRLKTFSNRFLYYYSFFIIFYSNFTEMPLTGNIM